MNLELFNYHLPEELIAQYPSDKRGGSRMLVVDRVTGECIIRPFAAFAEYVTAGDALLINNTKVMNARLFGYKNGDLAAAKIEIMLIQADSTNPYSWNAFIKPGKRVTTGTRIKLKPIIESEKQEHWAIVTQHCDDGTYMVEFDTAEMSVLQNDYGSLPLPPYIRRNVSRDDAERYQTVFAKHSGAVAAPTAGLHFTQEFLAELSGNGVQMGELTLHVGPGTFKPVAVENIVQHKMHSENFVLPVGTAALINSVHSTGKKIVAVGTTTVRVIESCADESGIVRPLSGSTDIFLYPPYRPRAVDMLLTNFHLPKSTLLMLVSTFSSREIILAAYEFAIREKMRFYSYGDCMLLK
jgi:S-adenosylmethionine:tRNA ribosyltransferase-isomerase